MDNNRLFLKRVQQIKGQVVENIDNIVFSAFTMLIVLIIYKISTNTQKQ